MIISINLFSLAINFPFELLEKIIADIFDSSLVKMSKSKNDVGDNIFTFTNEKDSIDVGSLIVKRFSKESIELYVQGYLIRPEDGQSDARLFIFRKTIENLLSILYKEKSLISEEQFREASDLLNKPISHSERNKIEQASKQEQENKNIEGIYSRKLFSKKCRTKPAYLEGILENYRIEKYQEGNCFWKIISIREVNNKPNTISYELNHEQSIYFGLFGQVDITSINDDTSIVSILTAGDIPSCLHSYEDGGKEMYFNAISELEHLASYLEYLFAENNSTIKSIKPGRHKGIRDGTVGTIQN